MLSPGSSSSASTLRTSVPGDASLYVSRGSSRPFPQTYVEKFLGILLTGPWTEQAGEIILRLPSHPEVQVSLWFNPFTRLPEQFTFQSSVTSLLARAGTAWCVRTEARALVCKALAFPCSVSSSRGSGGAWLPAGTHETCWEIAVTFQCLAV